MPSEDEGKPVFAEELFTPAELAEQVRAAGFVCPSCGVNMADLPKGHMLAISDGHTHEDGPGGAVVLARQTVTAECATGEPVVLMDATGKIVADWETHRNAANVALWDKVRFEDELFDELVLGEVPPGFSAAGSCGLPPPAPDGSLKFVGGGHE